MKLTLLLSICLLFVGTLFSQEKALKITNPSSDKEVVIKENKSIRIKITDGRKFSGRFTIRDANTIVIKNIPFKLSEIEKIKRHPLVMKVLISGVSFYIGTAFIATAVVLAFIFNPAPQAFFLALPAIGFIYGGLKPLNVLKGYKKSKGWNLEIVDRP